MEAGTRSGNVPNGSAQRVAPSAASARAGFGGDGSVTVFVGLKEMATANGVVAAGSGAWVANPGSGPTIIHQAGHLRPVSMRELRPVELQRCTGTASNL